MFNPFDYLGSEAAKIVADGWTAVMVSFWSAGLWVLRFVLGIVDAFMTPDISEGGPAAQIYRVTFWMGVALLSVLVMVQLGVAAFKRNGESVARLLIGVAQFVVVWAGWLSYAAVVIAGVGGLTAALLQTLLGVDTWAAWQPTEAFSTEDITDATLATVLGFMGLFLWLASIGHFIVMLARAAALMVLVATAPISAAGLSTELGRPWFWKSLRWFHAAAFAPVLMVLVLGIGVQITTGVVTGQADALSTTVGTAIPGVFLICIGCFAPLALFKLLAFVDPGTSSGAAMRTGLAGVGGFQGLMSGGGGGSGTAGTSGAASNTDDQGRSQAEVSGESDTSARTAKATGGLISTAGAALGPAGAGVGVVVSTGLGAMVSAGTKGAVIGADVSNQMGVGSNTYVPDFAGGPGRRRGFVQDGGDGGGAEDFDPDDDTQDDTGGRPVAPMPSSPGKDRPGGSGQTPPTPPTPPGPSGSPPGASDPAPGPAPSGETGGAGADAGAGGAGAGAAVVPPV